MEWNDTSMHARPQADVVLSSRSAHLRDCVDIIARGAGPIVIGGEAGIGKTWLRKTVENAAQGLLWIEIDASPGWQADDLVRAIARAAGLGRSQDATSARIALEEFLVEESENGRRWGLAIDEAQNASFEILEETRVLANRLGRAEGFESLILVGESSFTRRLGLRDLASLANRLAALVRLRPIDADEAKALLDGNFPNHAWDIAAIERLHRDSRGNPGRLLRLADRLSTRPTKPIRRDEEIATEPVRTIFEENSPPILGATRPPIRLEDGLIEVGWEPEAEAIAEPPVTHESVPARENVEVRRPIEEAVRDAIESIDDPYAAIQAWNEWMRNRRDDERDSLAQRALSLETSDLDKSVEARNIETDDFVPETLEEDGGESRVWSDHPHDFAPYSQLFSRARSLSERESGE